MSQPVDRTIVFAGAGSLTVGLIGRYVRVYEADATGVSIALDSGGPLLRFPGQEIDAGPGGFKRLQVSVTVASTVRIGVSETPQGDTNTQVSATVSATLSPGGTLPAGGDVACVNAAATLILAGNANGLVALVRSSDTNTYAEGTVRVGGLGVTAAAGIELNPGDVMAIDTTAAIYAYNNSGAAVTLQVLPLAK